MTNGLIDNTHNLNFSEEGENESIVIEYSAWDIARIFRVYSIANGDDCLEIDFYNNFKTKIQCLRVEDENPKVDAYFAIMPGNILAKVYDQYKQTLLEGNVRLFLQKTNRVNSQICKTIRECPEMFFSFNNGISATASSIEFGNGGSKTAPFITKITDLQIVNGGQTTASIAAMQDCDLSKVYVPMKISVIKDKDEYSDIVRQISTSANSQSAIKRSDFISGDEYLQAFEKISREEVEPSTNTKWYFERKRGQYKNDVSSLIGYDKTMFISTYPKTQILDKAAVAKLGTVWSMKPYFACKSKEVVTISYFSELREKANVVIDGKYYRDIVALYILFNDIIVTMRQAYGASFKWLRGAVVYNQMAYYIISSIAYLTNGKFNLDFIWNNKAMQEELKPIIMSLARLVNSQLYDNYDPKYIKDETCWNDLMVKLNELNDLKNELNTISKDSQAKAALANVTEDLRDVVFGIKAPVWRAISEWGKKTGKLSMSERMRADIYASKRKGNEKLQTEGMAEKALELEMKARKLGFTMDAF